MTDRKKNSPRPTRQQRQQQSQRDKARNQQQKKTSPKNRNIQNDSKFVEAPIAKSMTRRTQKPFMETKPNGDAHIRHREYVADIVAGTGTASVFTTTTYAVNPGQATTFPWLSRISTNYESYSFNSLRFDYETEAPSTLGGTLVLTLDYDASDPPPTSKQQAMTYRSAVRSAPWSACQHTSIKEDLHKSKTNFIRPGLQPAGTDIKTYDIGNLFAISQGVSTASAVLGELYVEYDVVLMTPVYEPPSPPLVVGGSIQAGGILTAGNPLGTVPVPDAQNVGIPINATSDLTFIYSGTYVIATYFGGTVLTNVTLTPSSGAVVVSELAEIASADALNILSIYAVVVTGPGNVSIDVTGTSVTNGFIMVGVAPTGSLT